MHSPLAHYLEVLLSPQHCQRHTGTRHSQSLSVYTHLYKTPRPAVATLWQSACHKLVFVSCRQREDFMQLPCLPHLVCLPAWTISASSLQRRKNAFQVDVLPQHLKIFTSFLDSSSSSLSRFWYWGGCRGGFW